MTQRFNAPPGWEVPENFVPPTGWQPDPSWPAAPAGWNFWVEDEQSAPAAGTADTTATSAGQPAANPQAAGYGNPTAFQGAAADPANAPGSAQVGLALAGLKRGRNTILGGLAIFVIGVIVNIVSFMNPGGDGRATLWYGIVIVGLAVAVRGIIEYFKAKKTVAQLREAGFAFPEGK